MAIFQALIEMYVTAPARLIEETQGKASLSMIACAGLTASGSPMRRVSAKMAVRAGVAYAGRGKEDQIPLARSQIGPPLSARGRMTSRYRCASQPQIPNAMSCIAIYGLSCFPSEASKAFHTHS